MATFKAVLNNKPKADGTYTIMMRITQNCKVKHLAVGDAVKKYDWNDLKGEVRKSNKLHKVINDAIEHIIIDAKVVAVDRKVSSNEIKKKLSGSEQGKSFIEFGERIVNDLKNKKQDRTSTLTASVVKKLKQFAGNISFSDINSEFLISYESHLINLENCKSTIHKDFSTLSTLFTKAIDFEFITLPNPFFKYKTERGESNRTSLTVDELSLLANFELSDKKLTLARDIFMFRFFAAGIRIGDCLQLRWSNVVGGRIIYTMSKTGEHKNIVIVDGAQKILDKYRIDNIDSYIFPVLDASNNYSDSDLLKAIETKTYSMNKKLRELAIAVGINKRLTTHVARHTFADYMRVKGADIYNISKALGHSSINMTQKYLDSLDQTSVDAEMMRYLNNT